MTTATDAPTIAAWTARATEPASHVETELALYAAALALLGWPEARWSARFIRNFRLVRTHLAPIATRSGLAASFGREAFRRPGSLTLEEARVTLGRSPVHAAYAVRWLELDPSAG